MHSGIYHNIEESLHHKHKSAKGRFSLKKVLDAAQLSMGTITEEKDKKGLLKKLTYKDKYLIYHSKLE